MEKRYLAINELAEYLRVKTGTIYSWVSQKKIPYKKFGRLVRFDTKEIEEWTKRRSIGVNALNH